MIPYSTQSIDADDIEAVAEVLRGPSLTQGGVVGAFEEALAAYCGARYAVVFNSATSALHGAYAVAGVGAGDEVITTPISFVATSNMVIVVGATPVFCDVKPDGNIDERKIEALISPRTKAIVPVDFGGKPTALEAIRAIADERGLLLIEDACHALGSRIGSRKLGSFADMTVFSFHAIKPITTGEGGAIVTDNGQFAERLRLFRSHGVTKKELWDSDMTVMGYNFRMTDVAAALGLSQLGKLDAFIERRNTIAAYYDERLQASRLLGTIQIPDGQYSARHLYPVLLAPQCRPQKARIFEVLRQRGLGVQVHYKPIHRNSFYEARFGQKWLPAADAFYEAEISIPCHQKMTADNAAFAADVLLETVTLFGAAEAGAQR